MKWSCLYAGMLDYQSSNWRYTVVTLAVLWYNIPPARPKRKQSFLLPQIWLIGLGFQWFHTVSTALWKFPGSLNVRASERESKCETAKWAKTCISSSETSIKLLSKRQKPYLQAHLQLQWYQRTLCDQSRHCLMEDFNKEKRWERNSNGSIEHKVWMLYS